jgi:streptomycin 6-kinase
MGALSTDFEPWLTRWDLVPDGWPFGTPHTRSLLLPVRHRGQPAVLKIAGGPEEARGGALMAWWAGDGAAPVLAHAPPALLMARAADPDALPRLAFEGQDDAATAILCDVARRLHGHSRPPPPELAPLKRWFRSLRRRAPEGGLFGAAWVCVAPLLAEPQELAVLHGDLTHTNVLDFGDAGWLAIDPKGLVGERGYDYANLFRSPTLAMATPGRYRRQLALVAKLSDLAPARLHRWVIGHGALSAAWHAEDGAHQSAATALTFVEMVLAQDVA